MAKYETRVFELKEIQTNLDLSKIPPNTVLVIVSDDTGDKKILGLDLNSKDPTVIPPDQIILRNTTDKLCYKLKDGKWQWVPC
jgi:hypothetical protein